MSRGAAQAELTAFADAIRAAGATDAGRVRDHNEDCFHVDAERGIFLVVDGVGGHAAGEVAATIAREVILERLKQDMWSPAQRVREALALANKEIFRRAAATPAHAGMTCVVTLALLHHGRLTIGHVGDSRLYMLSAQSLRKLTHDHSPIGEREDAGEISEADAMHHPRRNEVFRDVGSAPHEPDDPDFIELIETSFEPQTALLLCSDGLSDMLTAAAIERTVRQHAGNPDAVVHALVDAANDAGGRDNVTVVYVEGARFATDAATTALATAVSPVESSAAPAAGPQATFARRLFASRILWFTIGALAGVALAFAPLRTPPLDDAPAIADSRRLVVGGSAVDGYPSIAAALQAAGPRDVVEVEPGEYEEALVLPPGVQLTARVPGSVALVAPSGRPGFVSLTADGVGNRISGLRVVGRPDAPVAVGLRIDGHNVIVDDVGFEGRIDVGMDLRNDGEIVIRSSRFADLSGVAIRIGDGAKPAIRQNVFARTVGGPRTAIEVAAGATPQLTGNLFVGYAEADAIGVEAAPHTAGRELLRGNYVIRDRTYGR